MKNILAFSGSFSTDSINHKLVSYATSIVTNANVSVIRLSDFEVPIFRSELEAESGIPLPIQRLRLLFDEGDAFIISTPEYNGSIAAGLKNTLDWISRMEGKIFQGKPVLLMATSPGGRGGQSVLSHLSAVMPFWGAELIGSFSLPKFGENFSDGKISDAELELQLNELIKKLESRLKQA